MSSICQKQANESFAWHQMGVPWSSPSIAGKFAQNAQDVRFSDDATGMSHRNGVNFPKRAGNTNDLGSPFFWLLFFGEAKKSDSPRGERDLYRWKMLGHGWPTYGLTNGLNF